MKNLKKILIVIAMLALLVTSVVVVIGAEEEEDGYSVTELSSYVTTLKLEMENSEPNPEMQAKKLVDAYTFAHDITAEQLDALSATDLAKYNEECGKIEQYALTVATNLYGLIKVAEEDTAKSGIEKIDSRVAEILKVKKYLDAIENYSGGSEYDEIWTNLDAKNAEVIADYYTVVSENSDYTDAAKLEAARVATVKLYTQMNAYPISDAELARTYSLTAYDIARKMLDNYNALPDRSLTVDDVSDEFFTLEEGQTVTVEMKEEWLRSQYFKRINGIMLVQSFINVADISSSDSYSAFMDDYNNAMTSRNEELADQREKLASEADLVQYDYGHYKNLNFDGDWTTETAFEYATANPGNIDGEQYKVERLFETMDGKTTGYQSFFYGDPNKVAADKIPHNYGMVRSSAIIDREEGFVMEWDLRINEQFKSNSMSVTSYSQDGSGKHVCLFTIAAGTDGYLTIHNTTRSNAQLMQNSDLPKVTVSDAMAVGVWTHFSMTYNTQTKLGKLYVNYQYICDISYHGKDTGKKDSLFWFNAGSPENWGGWDIDNYEVYYGNQVRIPDKFSHMSDEDRFVYFVNFAEYGIDDPSKSTQQLKENYLARNTAYERAKALFSKFENTPKLKDTVDLFKQIQETYVIAIKKPAMDANLEKIQGKVSEILDGELTTENKDKKLELIKDLNSFVTKNSALINKADTTPVTGYQAQMSLVYALEADIEVLDTAVKFVEEMTKFSKATALSALTRHAASAEAVYSLAFTEEYARNLVLDDPVVKKFEQQLNGQIVDGTELKEGDEGYLSRDDENYIRLFDYYNNISKKLLERAKYENSKKIINAIDYITDIDGYVDTAEFWAANYSTIYDYMNMIRNFVNKDNYDAENADVAEDVAAAILKFREIDVYFYERLQMEHIQNIEAILAEYAKASTGIEKYAIVKSAQDYFEINDTALNNTAINKAVRMAVEDEKARLLELNKIVNDVYSVEVKAMCEVDENGEITGNYKDAYLDVLEQQTEYFINTVNYMNTAITGQMNVLISFSEFVELFDEATTYYYGINVNVEGAQEAVGKYAEYRAYITEVRENNAMLATYAKNIEDALLLEGAEKRDALYAALKNCREYVDAVAKDDSAVAGYLATYNTELAKYEAGVSALKAAIYESVQFTNAVRSESLPVTVLSVIGRLIND